MANNNELREGSSRQQEKKKLTDVNERVAKWLFSCMISQRLNYINAFIKWTNENVLISDHLFLLFFLWLTMWGKSCEGGDRIERMEIKFTFHYLRFTVQ